MSRLRYSMLALLALLAACAQQAGSADVVAAPPAAMLEGIDFDAQQVDGFDASKVSRYAFVLGLGAVVDPGGTWAKPDFDITSELRYLVDYELHQRGWTPVIEKPDVLLNIIVAIDTTQVWEVRARYGDDVQAPNLTTGGLLVEFRDPETNAPLWAAAATGPVRSDETLWTDKQAADRLAYIVHELFARLDAPQHAPAAPAEPAPAE